VGDMFQKKKAIANYWNWRISRRWFYGTHKGSGMLFDFSSKETEMDFMDLKE
jgi:hypothetical protein